MSNFQNKDEWYWYELAYLDDDNNWNWFENRGVTLREGQIESFSIPTLDLEPGTYRLWVRTEAIGYEDNGTYKSFIVIEPDEAEVVRFIFAEYLSGKSFREIATELDEKEIRSVRGTEHFSPQTIRKMISNEEYTGCQIYQQVYAYKPHKQRINYGELPKYRVDDHHEAIIDPDTFAAAQAMRKERGKDQLHEKRNPSAYSGMVWCGKCGSKAFMHSTAQGQFRYWTCDARRSKKSCDCKNWRDEELMAAVQTAIGEEEIVHKLKRQVERIALFDDHLELEMTNGRKRSWQKR